MSAILSAPVAPVREMWESKHTACGAMQMNEASDAIWPLTGEDDAVLEAALRFLDDDGAVSTTSCNATVSVDPSSPLSVHVQFTNTKKATSRKQCKRAKEQIEELREEAEDLKRVAKRLRSQNDTANTVSDMWEAMISRQLLQRHRAEVENESLRQSIREHSELVQKLEETIAEHKRRTIKTWTKCRGVISPIASSDAFYTVSAGSDVLESVTSALGPMYQQTKWVLTNPDLNSLAVTSTGCRVVTKSMPGIDGPTVHLMDSRTVPFDLTTTTHAVWENLIARLGSVVDPRDPSARVFRTEENLRVQLPVFDGTVHNIMALRRFDESDCVVMVRNSVFTYLGTEDGVVLPCLAVRHFLWTIIQRPRVLTPGQPPSTQIKTLGVSVPASLPGHPANPDAVNKFLTEISVQFCEFAHEDVDNCLLQARQGNKRTPPSVAMS